MPAVQGTVWGALSIWDKGIAGLHYLLDSAVMPMKVQEQKRKMRLCKDVLVSLDSSGGVLLEALEDESCSFFPESSCHLITRQWVTKRSGMWAHDCRDIQAQ